MSVTHVNGEAIRDYLLISHFSSIFWGIQLSLDGRMNSLMFGKSVLLFIDPKEWFLLVNNAYAFCRSHCNPFWHPFICAL